MISLSRVAPTASTGNRCWLANSVRWPLAYLAGSLAHAALGNQDMFLACRKDLLETAKAAVIAVEQAPFCDPETVKLAITVVGAVATFASGAVAIPLTGGAIAGPAAVAAFDMIAGISSGIAAADLGKRVETRLDDDTVDGVLYKMVEALTAITAAVEQKEAEMINALEKILGVITDGESSKLFLPPRPPVMTLDATEMLRQTSFDGT